MTWQWRSSLDPALYPQDADIQPDGPALSWAAILGGTVTAIAVSLVLFTIGSGFGLMEASPWPGLGPKPTTFSIGAGIWLIVVQWLSAAVGGYIAGRCRMRWPSLHQHETFFRDTAHGLVTWSLATVIVAAVAVGAATLAGVVDAAAQMPPPVSPSPSEADAARKVATAIAFFTGISMLVGAFIACVAAAIGGGLRDRHP
jgi:hypothetical protein